MNVHARKITDDAAPGHHAAGRPVYNRLHHAHVMHREDRVETAQEGRQQTMTSEFPPILLVEDSPIDVDLTLRAFARRKLANTVLVARDGEEALEWIPRWLAGEQKPAVILLDLNMPRVDGLTVLKEIKAHSTLQRIPVVILTTSREDRDLTAAYALGANSYIVKPVDFGNFMEVAQQIELYWCVLNERPK